MVNILGLDKADVLAALSAAARVEFKPLIPDDSPFPVPGCFWAIVNGVYVPVDLPADDGFDESAYDYALGTGAAQRAIDRLRMEARYLLGQKGALKWDD